MAQEKLLSVLVLLILSIPCAVLGQEQLQGQLQGEVIEERRTTITAEDKAWGQKVIRQSADIALAAIKSKYLELKLMEAAREVNDREEDFAALALNKPVLRIFVSAGMSRSLLKEYVKEARRYGAVLVFNGLPDGSWLKLAEMITDIAGNDDNVAMQIDDEAFKRFAVRSVPSFVLSEEEGWEPGEGVSLMYDKVAGNIGIRAALELFAREGDMAAYATELLNAGRGGGR